jgi:hypothetical protein
MIALDHSPVTILVYRISVIGLAIENETLTFLNLYYTMFLFTCFSTFEIKLLLFLIYNYEFIFLLIIIYMDYLFIYFLFQFLLETTLLIFHIYSNLLPLVIMFYMDYLFIYFHYNS